MSNPKVKLAWAAGAALIVALAGCGREADRPSRQLAEDRAPADRPVRAERVSRTYDDRSDRSSSRSRSGDVASDVVWASSRRGSAEENAERQFARNGQDFAAASVQDYARKARAFVQAPPRGALEADRSNGDRIYYDPKSNTFAAADRSGLPRTMFKPRDGRAYWEQQQQRLADGSDRASRRSGSGRSRDSGDDARG